MQGRNHMFLERERKEDISFEITINIWADQYNLKYHHFFVLFLATNSL